MSVRNVIVQNKRQARLEISSVGSDKTGVNWMTPKAVHRVLKITDLSPKQANIIKQEMLSRGGETAVARGVIDNSIGNSNILIMGTVKQFEALVEKLRIQPFGLSRIAKEIAEVLQNIEGRSPLKMECRGKAIDIGVRTLVMGVLNVTPDSFSDGGNYYDPGKAVDQALHLQAEGADILDIGGESTRPGHREVDADEEISRILPVLSRLVRELDIPVSVDTTKASVAARMLQEGAHIVNDQWGLQRDPGMARVVAEYQAPVVIMHNQTGTDYDDLMGSIVSFFRNSLKLALEAGIDKNKIIIDPGIGFGKTAEQNLEVMRRLRELDCLGLPILLGTSRKSTIGKVLDLPVDQRVEGTGATVALGIACGVDIVRVHDVKEMVRIVRMSDAIIRT